VKADPALAPAAVTYATRLRAAGKERRAMAALRDSWATNPQPEVAALALAPLVDPLARYQAATRFVEANPQHVESLVLLAQTALAAGLIGEAKRHAEAAQAVANQRRIGVLLADIAEAANEPDNARTALRASASAQPDPAWRCAQCGGLHGSWVPVCSACGTTGRVAWTEQPAAPILPAISSS
jgi:HemY protein